MVSRFSNWGATSEEVAAVYPCDLYGGELDASYYRAITVHAPVEHAYRWLCQLRFAPYSYDWIDNLGRVSPRVLTLGAENLEIGQRVMTIFHLTSFAYGQHLTIELDMFRRIFGTWIISYTVRPVSDMTCRYVVKLNVRYPRGLWGSVLKKVIPMGDYVMMRKQLLTLRDLCGAAYREAVGGTLPQSSEE